MAKIKRHTSDSHHTKPKGVSKGNFEKVYWPYIPLVLVISLLLVVGSTGGALKAAVHHPLGKVLSYSTSMSVVGLLADTNVARASNGVGALSLNDKLNAAAQANADDMAARNYWSHYTPEGNPPWIWVTNQGYSYQALAQNLAAGFSDEQNTINGWMASPPHRENMLNPIYTDVGFGYANNPNYTSAGGGPMTIVVAFYGKPTAPAPAPAAPVTHSVPPSSNASVQGADTSAPTTPAPTSTPAASTPTTSTPAPATASQSQPAATSTSNPKKSTTTTTSHLQLAAPTFSYGSLATKLALLGGIGLGIFWASRHLRAMKRFLLEGERYVVGHPLTDLGFVIIAALLFIVSQTAGLIQ